MEINQSLYEILGVQQDADLDTIKRAYRKLVQVHHPDKAGNSPENTERFAQICKAYEILSDPEKRALYDKPRRARTSIVLLGDPQKVPISPVINRIQNNGSIINQRKEIHLGSSLRTA